MFKTKTGPDVAKKEKKEKKQKKLNEDKSKKSLAANTKPPAPMTSTSSLTVVTSKLPITDIDSINIELDQIINQLDTEYQSRNYPKIKTLQIKLENLHQRVNQYFCIEATQGTNFTVIARLFNLRSDIANYLIEVNPRDKVLRCIKSGQFINALYKVYPSYQANPELPQRFSEYNTHQLVIAYNDFGTMDSLRKGHLEKIIFEIIEQFAQTKVWTPALMEAILPLGACQHPRIAKALLEKCLQRLRKSIFLDIALVNCISQLIRFTNHRMPDGKFLHALNGDDLVQVLAVINEQLDKLCSAFFNEEKLKSLLLPLVILLNTMLDQEVQGLDEEKTHPLAEFLHKLYSEENVDSDVVFYAKYAHQALARLPDKKNALSAYFGCGLDIFRGIVTISTAAWLMDPAALLEGILMLKENITDTIHVVRRRQQDSWYETLRAIEACMPTNKQDMQRLNALLCSPRLKRDENIAYGLILKLLPSLTSENSQLRRNIYGYLLRVTGFSHLNSTTVSVEKIKGKNIQSPSVAKSPKENTSWPIYSRVQERVLRGLNELPEFTMSSPAVLSIVELHYRTYLGNELQEIVTKNQTTAPSNTFSRVKKQLRLMSTRRPIAVSAAKNSTAVMQESAPAKEDTKAYAKQLVSTAYQTVLPLEYRVEQMWIEMQKRWQEPETSKNIACYVPLRGVAHSKNLENEQAEDFDLYQKVQSFLNDETSSLMLIQGLQGGGKSLFGKYLIRELWSRHNVGHAIPLFISLEEIRDPYCRLLERELENFGCSENEIKKIKKSHRFVIFIDAFNGVKNYRNLYQCNALHDWQAKVIITCRLGYLPNDYHNLFKTGNKSSLQECYIVPFRGQQINNYLTNLAAIKYEQIADEKEKRLLIEKEATQLKERLERLQVTKEILQIPLMLKFIIEILTDLEKKRSKDESDNCSWAIVCKAYIDRYYDQEELKIRNSADIKLRKTFQLRTSFQKFGEDLAWTMFIKKQSVIPINIDEYRTPEEIVENAWERFFTNKIPEIVASRSGVPLTYAAGNVQFINKSIEEYYIACRLMKEIALNRDEKPLNANFYFNQVKLIRELAIFIFLRDFINNNQDYIEALFEMIKFSEAHPECAQMAANAASLLAYMKIPFSGRKLIGVNIKGANLETAILDKTNLSLADMTGVNLHCTWLKDTQLREANMTNVNFGERPYLKHQNIVKNISFSPEGHWLATASGHVSYLWNIKNGELQYFFSGHTSDITCLAFSPDGKILATGSQDCTVKLWNVKTGELIHSFYQQSKAVTCIAFSTSGKKIASGSRDEIIRIWETKSGQLECELIGSKGWITSVAFYSDEQTIVSSSSLDYSIRQWDTQTKTLVSSLKGHKGYVYSLAINPERSLLASGSDDNTVCLWDTKTSVLQKVLTGHTKWVMCLAFSVDGEMLASGGWDNTVRIWDIKTKSQRKIYTGHSLPVQSIAFNKEGDIASAGGNEIVKLWSTEVFELKNNLAGHASGVRSVTISKDGCTAASASIDKSIKLWDALRGTLRSTITGHTAEVRSVVMRNTGEVISGSNDKTARLWDSKGNLKRTFNGHTREVISMALCDDDNTLATGSWDNTVRVWDVNSGYELGVLNGHTGAVFSIAFGKDKNMLVSGSRDQTVRIWNTKEFSLIHTLKGHAGEVRSVAVSPSGESIISGSHDKTVRQWNLKTGETQQVFTAQPAENIESLAFSPDGEFFAAGCITTIQIWAAETKQQIAVLTGFRNQINSLVWHTNGCLITGCADHSVRCWQPLSKSKQSYNNYTQWKLVWRTHATMFFSEDCHIDKVKGLTLLNARLLEQGGSKGLPLLASQDFPDWTPLQFAVASNQFEKAKEIVALDPQLLQSRTSDEEENSLLHLATRYRADINLVKWLVENGVKLELVNAKGKTAKKIAKELNRTDLLPFLKNRSSFKDDCTQEMKLSALPQGFINSLNKSSAQNPSSSDRSAPATSTFSANHNI